MRARLPIMAVQPQDWLTTHRSSGIRAGGMAIVKLGRLERVLPDWRSPAAPIYALMPSTQHVARKTRLFLSALSDALKSSAGA